MGSIMAEHRVAVLLIAHGSRRAEANADLEFIASGLREHGRYPIVKVAFLELALPTIPEGGRLCVEDGATDVILLPYFLSPGVHVVEDLSISRQLLSEKYPAVKFVLADPLGRHPLLVEVVAARAREAEDPQEMP